MGSTCRRVGCREHAVAALRFDAADAQVWIDSWIGPDDNGQWLCALHLLRFTAPAGWRVIDRRGAGPEVVISERSPLVSAPPPAASPELAVPPAPPSDPVERPTVESIPDGPKAAPSGLLGKALAAVGDQRSILTGVGIDATDDSVPDA